MGKKVTIKKSGDWFYGTNSKDTVTVTAKKNVTVIGNKGNDIITVKKGNNHTIYGDGETKSESSYYNSSYTGKDTITLTGGKGHSVYAGKSADKIYVKKGAGFSYIDGMAGNDIITVYQGAKAGTKSDYSMISGGSGKDTITVTNTKAKYYKIYGDDGNDTIKVTGGSYYKIQDGNWNGSDKNTISLKSVNHFEVSNSSKGSITVTKGKNGSVYAGENTAVKVYNSNSLEITGGKIDIKTGTKAQKFTISGETSASRTCNTNESLTIRAGYGTANLREGTDTVTIDFKNPKQIGNWDISAAALTNNRMTVLNAASSDFTFERKTDSHGLGILVDADCWIITHKSGARIILSGWSQDVEKTFDIYFKKDNMIASSEPAQDQMWQVKPY